jgi:hypothetical protein
MNILQRFDGFQFHNDFVADDQVELVQTNVLFLKDDVNLFLESSMPQSDFAMVRHPYTTLQLR